MSSVELMDLPDHVLSKILSYIPDHFIVASVCQKFYELDCLNHRNLEMRLDFFGLADEAYMDFDSIQLTNRVFRSIDIKLLLKTFDEFKNLKEILQQHGSTIKELKLKVNFCEGKFQLPEKELVELLKLFPELEKLDISMERTEIVEEDKESSDKSPFLPKLKELVFSTNLMKFFTKNLPENVKKVVENDYHYNSNEESTENLLKVLETRNLEKIRLTNVFYEGPRKWSFFTKFLKSQPNLKSLEIVSEDLNEEPYYPDEIEFFSEVVKLKNLEHLTIGEINRAFVEKFPEMNLKSLEVISLQYKEDRFSEFCLQKPKSLEKMILPIPSFRQKKLKVLGQNFPLKSLKLDLTYYGLNEVLQMFPLLKSLEVTEGVEEWEMFHEIYDNDGQVFENLKYLSFTVSSRLSICHQNFLELLKALPNLEKVHVTSIANFEQRNFFSDLKTNLPKIREIYLALTVNEEDLEECSLPWGEYCCSDIDCSLSGNEISEEGEQFLNEDSIKALQEFSRNEKLINFECHIQRSKSYEYCEEIEKLQGYFRINVKSGKLTLKKGKVINISIPECC